MRFFSGISALLIRALREDALLLRYHLLRGGFIIVLIFIAAYAAARSSASSAPGLELFRMSMHANLILVCLAGAGYFSSAIAEEKEEETLGLLLMAGVSRLGIMFGKSTSRLVSTLVLGLIELPFLLLAVTLGGVTQHQVWCGFAMVAAFTVLVANLGLLCSVICSTTAAASRWMIGIILFYLLFPPIMFPIWITSVGMGGTPSPWEKFFLDISEWIYATSPWSYIKQISETGYAQHPFTLQVQSNLIAGGLLFAASWLLFDRFARDLSQTARPRPQSIFQRSQSRSRRCWGDPFIWKDFVFQAGGLKRILYTSLFLTLGMLVYAVYCFGTWASTSSIWDDNFLGPALILMIFVAVLHLSFVSARFLSAEYRDHTLPMLFLTPNGGPKILYGKLLGTFAGALPTLGLTFALWWALMQDSTWHDDYPKVILFIILFIAVYLHIVVLLSLFLKWGAIPAAIGVMLVGTFFWIITHFSSTFSSNGEDAFAFFIMELLILNAILHAAIAARIWIVVQK
ncbi:MAG: ABC transporter permease subunit [Planctomycetaceae bacterium]|nr:ABC transporter permease subunit [Planctomycetaceae bacterium]